MASKSSVATKNVPTKAKAAPPKDAETPEKDGAEASEKDGPLPLLDLSDAAVKKMIKQAKKRGYVTYEQLNAVMPSEEVTSEKIEDVLAIMNEMGINVVETEEAETDEEEKDEPEEEESESGELVEVAPKAVAKSEAKEPTERTDDPVRMYLREMGSVELLSREGEIAIAKRIEAGREAMIAGLCESPLTFQAVIIWRDELNEGKVFLRDIIDLDATYAGPDTTAASAPVVGPAGQLIPPSGQLERLSLTPGPAVPSATPFKPAAGEETVGDGNIAESALDEDDDTEIGLSVGTIEAELKPFVIETFDTIADTYQRLRRLQDCDMQFELKRRSLTPAQQRKYKKLKSEIISEIKSLRLNEARI